VGTGIIPTGAYDNGRTYDPDESVSYLGGSYVALVQTTGNLPTDATRWQVVALPGAVGSVSSASGLTLEHISTPAAPDSGDTIVYAKSDGGIYGLGSTGSEFRLTNQAFASQHTATSLAAGGNSDFDVDLGNAGVFTTIQSDKQAWLTAYISSAARVADGARLITTDPSPGSGVLADIIFASSSTISLTPTVNYWAPANIFFRLRNTGSTTQTVVLTINGVRFN
jgi:hypothetical protein